MYGMSVSLLWKEVVLMLKKLINMFVAFAKVGCFTFGGGYAMLPMLQREIVEKNKWATEEELVDYFAIGQCTPGIIAVNTATFVGFKAAGILGGIVATLGLVFPSLVIIMVIAAFIRNFMDIEVVQNALKGIQVCVCALILDAKIRLGKKTLSDKYCVLIFLVAFFAAQFSGISTIFVIIGAGMLGILISILKNRKERA